MFAEKISHGSGIPEYFFQVQRTYKDFEELDKFLRSSRELSPLSGLLPLLPVHPACEEHSSYLAEFLERLLLCVDDYIWSCPPILSFLDDSQGKGGFKDVHIAILEEKVNIISQHHATYHYFIK